jgi:hypothetical protein
MPVQNVEIVQVLHHLVHGHASATARYTDDLPWQVIFFRSGDLAEILLQLFLDLRLGQVVLAQDGQGCRQVDALYRYWLWAV